MDSCPLYREALIAKVPRGARSMASGNVSGDKLQSQGFFF